MANLRHAAVRAYERHGLLVTNADLDAAALDIIATLADTFPRAVLLQVKPTGVEIWLVRLCGRAVRVAYLPKYATIISVLPNRSNWQER